MSIFKTLLYIHIASGAISLLLGLFILCRKKADKTHRAIGKIYFYGMLTAAVASMPMSYLHPNFFLFIIALFTTYMLLTGRRYLKKKQLTAVTSIDWGLTVVMFAFAIVFILLGTYKIFSGSYFGSVLLIFGGFSLLFVLQDKRNFQGKSRYKNFWLIMHIQRMVASYISTATAFLVVNNQYMPGIFAWLLPTALLVPLLIKWTIKYEVKITNTKTAYNN